MRAARLLLVAILLAPAACAATGDGPVEPGLTIDQAAPPAIGVFFPGPALGATPEAVVRGFLQAGANSGTDDVARSFLAPSLVTSWASDGEVVVVRDETDMVVTFPTPSLARVTAPVLASIGADGRWQQAAPGASRTVEIRLGRVDGEWRIVSLPKSFGRWLATRDLDRLYAEYAVHFVARDRRQLVPVLRWFPLDRLTTSLARAQLMDVPADLAGVATTAVPRGARLLSDAVPVLDGLATVNLSESPTGTDPGLRADLWAQFVGTLVQDPTATEVTLQVDGASLEIPGVQTPVTDLAGLGFPTIDDAPRGLPVIRRGTQVRIFRPEDEGRSVKSLSDPVYPPVPTSYGPVALSMAGDELAAVATTGRTLSRWRATTRYDVPAFAVGLGRPAYDRRGLLWVGGVGSGARAAIRLWWVRADLDPRDPAAVAHPVTATWLAGRVVRECRVSPDGERLAVLSTDAAGRGARLDVTGVVRDQDGWPVALASPVRLGAYLGPLRAPTWVDDTTLAVLSTVGGVSTPQVLSLSGSVTALPPVAGAVDLVSLGGTRRLVAVLANGSVALRSGLQWLPGGQGSGVAAPAG